MAREVAIQALDLGRAGKVATGWQRSDALGIRLPNLRVVWVLRVAIAGMVVAQLGRIPFLSAGDKDAPLLINDLLILTVVGAGILAALRNRRLRLDGVGRFALAFAMVGGISAVLAIPRFGLSGTEFVFSIAYLFRWLAYFGIYVAVVNFVQMRDLAGVWRTLESAALAFSAFGIFQSLFLPNFAQIVYPSSEVYTDWDPQGHRLVSTFLDPNFAGAFIAMVLLVAMARMTYGVETPRWKLFVLFVALALAVSRGAVLGIMAGTLLIVHVRGLSRGLIRFAAIGAVFLVAALPVVIRYAVQYNKFTVDASAMTRVFGWLTGLQVFVEHPIIGVGFNTYGFVQARLFGGGLFRASFGLDGGLLFVAVLTGVVGLTFYVAMIASVFSRCRRVWRDASRPADDRGLCLGVAALTVGITVHSFFLNTLFYPFLMEPLWVLWGITLVVAREQRAADAEALAPAATPRIPILLTGAGVGR